MIHVRHLHLFHCIYDHFYFTKVSTIHDLLLFFKHSLRLPIFLLYPQPFLHMPPVLCFTFIQYPQPSPLSHVRPLILIIIRPTCPLLLHRHSVSLAYVSPTSFIASTSSLSLHTLYRLLSFTGIPHYTSHHSLPAPNAPKSISLAVLVLCRAKPVPSSSIKCLFVHILSVLLIKLFSTFSSSIYLYSIFSLFFFLCVCVCTSLFLWGTKFLNGVLGSTWPDYRSRSITFSSFFLINTKRKHQ